MNMKIYMIVPRLKPSVDGVGDYSLILANKLKQNFNIETNFLVMDPAWNGGEVIEDFKINKILSRSKKNFLELVNPLMDEHSLFILQYVGYGYAKRGCPLWLLTALTELKRKKKITLISMFHELYAFGPIWTSQFWTSLIQKFIFKKLVKLSFGVLTSKAGYANLIEKHCDGKFKQVSYFTVFSNIGEPNNFTSLDQRERTLVIFGGIGPKERVYSQSVDILDKICKKFNINKIVDIGKSSETFPASISGIKVTYLGILASDEISNILKNSLIGFLNYPFDYLEKSGIFAAYTSHGNLIVADSEALAKTETTTLGKHFISPRHLTIEGLEFDQIAKNAFDWYQEHRSEKVALEFYKMIKMAQSLGVEPKTF